MNYIFSQRIYVCQICSVLSNMGCYVENAKCIEVLLLKVEPLNQAEIYVLYKLKLLIYHACLVKDNLICQKIFRDWSKTFEIDILGHKTNMN